jgi:hypothetical protein
VSAQNQLPGGQFGCWADAVVAAKAIAAATGTVATREKARNERGEEERLIIGYVPPSGARQNAVKATEVPRRSPGNCAECKPHLAPCVPRFTPPRTPGVTGPEGEDDAGDTAASRVTSL